MGCEGSKCGDCQGKDPAASAGPTEDDYEAGAVQVEVECDLLPRRPPPLRLGLLKRRAVADRGSVAAPVSSKELPTAVADNALVAEPTVWDPTSDRRERASPGRAICASALFLETAGQVDTRSCHRSQRGGGGVTTEWESERKGGVRGGGGGGGGCEGWAPIGDLVAPRLPPTASFASREKLAGTLPREPPPLPVLPSTLAKAGDRVVDASAASRDACAPPRQNTPQQLDYSRQGSLLKLKAGPGGCLPIAQAVVEGGSLARAMFWRRRYFELRPAQLVYRAFGADGRALTGTPPLGAFPLSELDEVAVKGRDVALHFAVRQRTGTRRRNRASLCLRATSGVEAERWGTAVRNAAAVRLRERLPREWDVPAMLAKGKEPVRLVKTVVLPQRSVDAVQRLLDHSFVCKRTKDRGSQELPVRLEVVQVSNVQNFAAWVKYTRARDGLASKAANSQAGSPGLDTLGPSVLTGSHNDSFVRTVLGELDESANEHWLFHGTTAEAVECIAHRDFRLDLAGSHRGTLYGRGVYLAECSSKADEYSDVDQDGFCRMLLCRAALGRIMVNAERDPGKDIAARCKANYDSLCGDRWRAVGTYREFVLYNNKQFYPECIIVYKRVTQAELLAAVGAAAEHDDMLRAASLLPTVARLAETHPDPVVRYRIHMLLEAHTKTTAPALALCLRDERSSVRCTVSAALGQLGSHATATLRVSGSDHPARKAVADHAVPALSACLADPSENVRAAAAAALMHFGKHAAGAVPALSELLRDSCWTVRESAAVTLGELAACAASSAPALAECLMDASSELRKRAVKALGKICQHAPHSVNTTAAVASFMECLCDSNAGVREAAADALQYVGPHTTATLSALTKCFDDSDPAVRKAAANAIGQPTAHAALAAPQLVELLKDTDQEVRTVAAVALGRMGYHGDNGASVVSALHHCIKDKNVALKAAAIAAIGRLGANTTTATTVPGLIRCLRDANAKVRQAAATTLGQLGSYSAAVALPALVERIKDTDSGVRDASTMALVTLSGRAEPAVPALTAFLEDPDSKVRRTAAMVLGHIASAASHAPAESSSGSSSEGSGAASEGSNSCISLHIWDGSGGVHL